MCQVPPPEDGSVQMSFDDVWTAPFPPTGPHYKEDLLDELMRALGMETGPYTPDVKPRRKRRG